MTRLITFTSLLFCCFLFSLSSATDVSVAIERIIDISNQFVEEEIYYEISNSGTSPLASVEIAIKSENLSLWSIHKVTDKKGENEEIVEKLSAIKSEPLRLETQNDISYSILEVSFKNALQPKGKTLIKVHATYTHELTPKPKEITQEELQQMVFKGNFYVASVYPTKQQVTQVRCMQVISYSDDVSPTGVNEEKQIVTFGPYKNVPAWSFVESYVHMYNTARFVTVDNLVRDIEVSHWGNVAVEESYLLHHGGTPLKGTFSRLDYMMGKVGNSIPKFVQHLPEGAWEIYYRDIIGNISTSNAFPHRDFVMFEIQPRFVMFGGWQDEFKIGYNLPTNPYLVVDGDRFKLTLPFINNFEDAVFDDVLINVILPEGSYDVKIESSVNFYEQKESAKKTYLDTTGRVVFSLRASNLVSEHRYQNLVVSYKFETSTMIREPLFLIGGYCLLFLAIIIYFRTNFSILDNSGEQSENESKAIKLGNEYIALLGLREAKYDNMGQKNLAKKLGQYNTDMNASATRAQSIISKISAVNPDLASQARSVEQKSKAKTIAFRQLQTGSQDTKTEKGKLRAEQLKEDFIDATESLNQALEAFKHTLSE
eukprot:CAMPEP_0117029144 /NCGR_PEP_ID=MMETSP0472-20121206/21132_1 /TAXON_ID=693140 ORGANISM="Tiarina fusus, Strain LIS" /NCGR_SAMPLE_ID=MMETSP0472 /ASSEMBLY_ACC=CAM_ASM_000603 /LENGTH=596 /DNA_ID=CAMNT_0004736835 /DNA_START=8 /DNA_END=1798 /DNA_ORIENTATION=+